MILPSGWLGDQACPFTTSVKTNMKCDSSTEINRLNYNNSELSSLNLPLSHQGEGNVLRPEHDVDVEAEPVDRDLHALGDGVDPADAIEDDVDGADEDLPDAVEREEVT